MKVLPCDLSGQVILRPRWRYIYIILTYTRAHTESMHTYKWETTNWQKVHVDATGYVSLTTSTTPRSYYGVLTKGPWSFPALFLFSHIFLLSHTFVDILCCCGANVCQRSPECFKLPALHCWWFYWGVGVSLHCRPVFSFFGVCSAFIRCLLMLYPHCIWSRVHLLRTKIKSVSPLIFLQHTKFLRFSFWSERGGLK